MIAVLFEVWPYEQGREEYLDIAASLRPRLDAIDGFVSVERFQSLGEPSKLLSVSFFRDEQAITAWRDAGEHRTAQAKGRGALFRDYRLRVATVVRDYGMLDRAQAPQRRAG